MDDDTGRGVARWAREAEEREDHEGRVTSYRWHAGDRDFGWRMMEIGRASDDVEPDLPPVVGRARDLFDAASLRRVYAAFARFGESVGPTAEHALDD